jgi:hypothetical protein
MMTHKCRHGVALVALVASAACSRHAGSAVTPSDPLASIGVSQIPTGSLAGSAVLLFPIGGILFSDSLSGEALRRADLLDRAVAVVDSTLRRDGRGITWQGLAEMRATIRRSPALSIADPASVPTGFLLAERVEAIPDPLWSSLRALAALSGARMALIPVAVRLDGSPGAVRASYVFAMLDTRLGQMVWRGRVTGQPAASAEAALVSAAATVVPSVR